ncbi:MAG TPA: hypothetical protein VNL71_13750 [Chloroflexota bacterium]|nr:hypothetical protein [Chloroflexota bacterium]
MCNPHLGVSASPVAADHLHAGMVVEPTGQHLGGSVGEQVHHLVPLQIDQDRPIRASAFLGPIVHPEDLRGGSARQGYGPHEAEQTHPAGGQPEQGGQAGAGIAAQRESDRG